MAIPFLSRRRPSAPLDNTDLVVKALKVAQVPSTLSELRPEERERVDRLAKAITAGASWSRPACGTGRPWV